MDKVDLRITKSEQAIEQAFLELVEEKGFENIHIVDIATKANVNRNTIYLRYGTKEDIIETMINKLFDEQLNQLDTEMIMKTRTSRKAIQNMFISIFSVLSKEIDVYRIILTDPNLLGYANKMIDKVRKMMLRVVQDTKKNKIIVEYLLKGAYGIITMWIIYDTGSIEENAKILSDLVISNARHLSFK